MRQEKKTNNVTPEKSGTLIKYSVRRIVNKFKERLEKENKFCPATAEAIYRTLVKDPNADIDMKTKVLCYLMLDKADDIRELGPDALPLLVDAQTIEEFDIGKRATKLLVEGIKKNGTHPIAEVVTELEEIRKTASRHAPEKEPTRLETEETLPSLKPEVTFAVSADACTEARKLMSDMADFERYHRRIDAVSRLAELAEGPDSEKIIMLMNEEFQSARETYRSILPALLSGNFDDATPAEMIILAPKIIEKYECAATETFHLTTCFGRTGSHYFLPVLKNVIRDDLEEGSLRREATRAVSAIILKNFNALEGGSLDSWFKKYVEPIGERAAVYILEETACAKHNGMRESAEAAIKAIQLVSGRKNGLGAGDARA